MLLESQFSSRFPLGSGYGRRGPLFAGKRDPAAPASSDPVPAPSDAQPPRNTQSEADNVEDVYDEPRANSTAKADQAFPRSYGAVESKEADDHMESMVSDLVDRVAAFSGQQVTLENHSSYNITTRPALRFVRHVTCPDGTLVPPGVRFCKTWRVRNDGNCAWPHGTVLVHSGGDLLTYEEPLSIDALPGPGEEVDITINLKGLPEIRFPFILSNLSISHTIISAAPECTGRFVSYFRMQSPRKDEFVPSMQFFGQRLWADVVVSEVEPDWQVVHTATATLVTDNEPLKTTDTTSAVAEKERDGEVVEEPSVEIHRLSSRNPEAITTTAVFPAEAEPVAADAWGPQLEELTAMGFFDRAVLVPLLERHWSAELGLQAVIDELLQ